MQKKLIKLFLLSAIFSVFVACVFVEPVSAGIVLIDGEFVVLGTDPSLEDYENEMLFQEMTLEIDNLGKVKGMANINFSDLNWKGALFSVNATLNLEGSYDAKENSLSGNFIVKHTTSIADEEAPPLISFYNDEVMTFEGTISGGWSTKNSSFEIFFNGTKRSVGTSENSNGKKDEYDRSTKWNNKAVFLQDLCDSLIAKAESEKNKKWGFIGIAQAKDSGARFTAFSGEVLVSPKGNLNDERPAEDDMVLEEGDIVTTGGDSCAIISFADMSTFIMKARSKVVLDSAPEKQSKLKLVAGNIWVNLKHIYETGHLDVTMNQAIAGTKGTTFVASEDGINSTIKVVEGLMSFKSLVTGEEVDVGVGEMASVNSSGIIEKTTFDADAESISWEKIQNNLLAIGSGPASAESTTEASVEDQEPKSKATLFIIIVLFLAVLVFIGMNFVKKNKNVEV